MKVTKEMKFAAFTTLRGYRNDKCTVDDVGSALEVALADVPDIEAQWYEHKERADCAEAKLAKVREWREGKVMASSRSEWSELDAILEEP